MSYPIEFQVFFAQMGITYLGIKSPSWESHPYPIPPVLPTSAKHQSSYINDLWGVTMKPLPDFNLVPTSPLDWRSLLSLCV